MTYFGFLAAFLVPPTVVLLWLLRSALRREHFIALGVLMLIALLYTSPWDNYLVIRGVWSFDRDKITELFIWRVPLEEYIFYLLQVLMTGLFTIWLLVVVGDRWSVIGERHAANESPLRPTSNDPRPPTTDHRPLMTDHDA
jgi:lycopene cyclase domain-containing protein